MGESTGNADIDFPDFGSGLFFRVGNGTADCLIQLARIVPAFFQVTVIFRYACRNDVAALAAAVFGNERNNFACSEVNGCNRCFHTLSNLPCSGMQRKR